MGFRRRLGPVEQANLALLWCAADFDPALKAASEELLTEKKPSEDEPKKFERDLVLRERARREKLRKRFS